MSAFEDSEITHARMCVEGQLVIFMCKQALSKEMERGKHDHTHSG
jgi:hypothetical protein